MATRQEKPLDLEGWPMLRRDASASGSDGSTIIPPLEKAWEFRAGNKIESQLAVAYGTIFFGCKDKNVYAVDARTGQGRWTFKMEKDVVTTPVVADGTVYVASKDKHLYALDAKTGETRWQHSIGSDISSTPAVGHGMVFFGSKDKHVYALDAQTGQQRWAFNSDAKSHFSPVIAEGMVLTSGKGRTIYAINALDGELVWVRTTNTVFSPVLLGKFVLHRTVGGGLDVIEIKEGTQIGQLLKSNVRDISANRGVLFVTFITEPEGLFGYNISKKLWTGDVSWDLAMPVWRTKISIPAVGGDFAFMSGLGSKTLFGINVSKVMKRWWLQLDDKLKSPPVISDGMLFVACDKGKVLAFKGTSDPRLIKTLEPRPEALYITPEPTFNAMLYQETVLWPNRCCLCCGPAEEKEKIFMIEGGTRLTLQGVPYCTPCKQKVKKRFGRGEKPGVDIIKVKPPMLAFRSEKYWVMFMETNRLR